jgi:trans-2,3-dihydro-3-hydroxyanthranilate isomerase
MPDKTFHIVDVFAEQPYSGNQLAVFMDGAQYSDAAMQTLAKEMNYSETTFILPQDRMTGHYPVRIFTPAAELPFAGHPTLGTTFIIARELLRTPAQEIVLDLKAGAVPVRLSYDAAGQIERVTMQQLPPAFGQTLDAATAARFLGLPEDAIDPRYPVQEVSAGMYYLIVPLRDLAAIRAIRVDPAQVAAALESFEAKVVLTFCPQTYEPQNQLNARVFVHHYGIPEDPATGGANGPLLAYLLHHRYLGSPSIDIRVEQGYEIGRKSILYLTGQIADDAYQIHIGGKVQHIARGQLS